MFKEVGELGFPEMERRWLAFWEQGGVFDRLREKNRGGERYSFIDGPITANNPRGIGVHHAWGRTYKDVFQRHRAMKGSELRFQNGFDCQGLWVEVEVEKALGLNGKPEIREYGLDRFARQCRERVDRSAAAIVATSRRLGQWMDWENSYFTYSDTNIEHIWHFLKHCHERGWLYLRGRERDEINKGGTKVYPSDIDAVAERFPGVNDVCCFAVEDPLYGQNVGLAVALEGGDDAQIRGLYSWLKRHLAEHQMPMRWHRVTEIPRTSRGKINRAEVAKSCAKEEPLDLRAILQDRS